MFYTETRKRYFILFLCLTLFPFTALFPQQSAKLRRNYTFNLPADSLTATLRRVTAHTGATFAYDPEQLRHKRNPDLHFVQVPLEEILGKILSGTGLGFSPVARDIVIAPEPEKTWSIHGHIRDAASGEELIGAIVQIPALGVGISTNQYGFYSISVPQGVHELFISYSGYQAQRRRITLDRNLQEEIELSLQPRILEEVVIRKSSVSPNPILMNEQNVTVKQLSSVAYYAGETDVMKRLQMQNGIRSITEGSSSLFVRGGNSDQNLILLDEAVVYNPSHLYGLISVFNSDVVNNIQVYRDYMPANFGGRLSSVIVNRMTEGNNKEYHVSGGINPMSVRVAAEGPIVKEKGSFMAAYRRSMLDVFRNKFKLFNPNSVYYDINAKANYRLDSENAVFYSVYLGKDNLRSENSYINTWGNLTSTFRWNHIFNSRVFLNVSAIYSDYSNLLDLNADTLSEKSQWRTGIKDLTVKADYTYYRSPTNQIKFGLSGIYHRFTPGEMDDKSDFEFNIARDRSVETAIYFTQEIGLSKSFELNYGLRLSYFGNSETKNNLFDNNGNRIDKKESVSFFRPEPRINISFLPSEAQRVFLTYNLNYQYLQLVQNSVLAFSSLEPWIPASASIRPQSASQVALGYRYSPDGYDFQFSTYYKYFTNQLELAGHAQIIRNPAVRQQLLPGYSRAAGLETEISRSEGRFTGTVAYTYSRVYRQQAGINSGARYVANYDIPHELKFNAKMDFNNGLSVQSAFVYSTGRPLTLPVGYYQHDGLNIPIYEGRNTSRFPDFHRLDLSAQYRLQTRIKGKRSMAHVFSAGVYNVYNRKNPLYYRMIAPTATEGANTIEYGFGCYPWIAYSFKI